MEKIKHDWYQTESHVVVEIRVKSVPSENVTVNISEAALGVCAKLTGSSEYNLELDLAHPVVPDQSSHRVLPSKIEVKLKKKDGYRWDKLEREEGCPAVAVAAAASVAPATCADPRPPSYPSSSGKNWNKIAQDIDKELSEEKMDGDAALQDLFNKIYANADEDTKRAMNKSFQESGGTVLSTNWSDVGKGKVEIKPPEGSEFRKWDS